MNLPLEPYFDSSVAEASRPRLVLLSKHFPPSEEAGALRWQKLAQLVVARGWGLDVVARDVSELALADDARLRDLPRGVRVFGVRTPPMVMDRVEGLVVKALAMVRAVRQRVTLASQGSGTPTASVSSIGRHEAGQAPFGMRSLRRRYEAARWRARELAWANAAARVAEALLSTPRPLAIISCGPPHQIHVAARRLAARYRLPFVMDMRDPWSLVERMPEFLGSPSYWTSAAHDERRCVQNASLIVVNTPAHQDALARAYPPLAGRIITVLNGFDQEQVAPPRSDGPFTLVYAGTVYLDRDPRVLLKAVALVIARRGLTPADVRIEFMGSIESYQGFTLEQLAAELNVGAFVVRQPRLPRREALVRLADAHMLVVLPQDSHLAIPSKVYEYMLYPAWMLVLAEPNSSVASVLAGSSASVVLPQDVAGIADAIEARFDYYRQAGRPNPLATELPHLSRVHQGTKLLDAVAQLSSQQPMRAVLTTKLSK